MACVTYYSRVLAAEQAAATLKIQKPVKKLMLYGKAEKASVLEWNQKERCITAKFNAASSLVFRCNTLKKCIVWYKRHHGVDTQLSICPPSKCEVNTLTKLLLTGHLLIQVYLVNSVSFVQ